MRVITGQAKGRKLKAPKGMTTRPTSDRVKEALFNVLAHHIPQARFLDLFAGSGNVGIEALSRGANQVVFIEENPKVIKVIQENLTLTKLTTGAKVYCNNVYRALVKLGSQDKFDIIFLDPPYRQGHEIKCLELIDQGDLLQPQGIAVVESSKKDELPSGIGKLCLLRTECYGDTRLTYYTKISSGKEASDEDCGIPGKL